MDYKYFATPDFNAAIKALNKTKFDNDEDAFVIASAYASLVSLYPDLNKGDILKRLADLKAVHAIPQHIEGPAAFYEHCGKITIYDSVMPIQECRNWDNESDRRSMYLIHESIHAITNWDNVEKNLLYGFRSKSRIVEACTDYITDRISDDLGLSCPELQYIKGIPVYGSGYWEIGRIGKAMEIMNEDVHQVLFGSGSIQFPTSAMTLLNNEYSHEMYDENTAKPFMVTRELYRLNFLKEFQSDSSSFSSYMSKTIELYKDVSERKKIDGERYHSQSEELTRQDVLMWCKFKNIPPEKTYEAMADADGFPNVLEFAKCCKLIRESGKTYTDEEFLNAQYASTKNYFSIKIGNDLIEGEFIEKELSLDKKFFGENMPSSQQYFRIRPSPCPSLGEYKRLGFDEKDLTSIGILDEDKIPVFYKAFTCKKDEEKDVYAHIAHINSNPAQYLELKSFEKFAISMPPNELIKHIDPELQRLYFVESDNGAMIIESFFKTPNYSDTLKFLGNCNPDIVPDKLLDIEYIASLIGENPICKLYNESFEYEEIIKKLGWNANYIYNDESLISMTINKDKTMSTANILHLAKLGIDMDSPVGDKTFRDYVTTLSPSSLISIVDSGVSAESIFPEISTSAEKPLFSTSIPLGIYAYEQFKKTGNSIYEMEAIIHGISLDDTIWAHTSARSQEYITCIRKLANFCSMTEETDETKSKLIKETKTQIEAAFADKNSDKVRSILDNYEKEANKLEKKKLAGAGVGSMDR